jgi:plasmid stabilization system protein ParE
MPPRIRIHIDEIVLHGFEPGERRRIADALQARLAELLADTPLTGQRMTSISLERADAGTISIPEGAAAAAVGEGIAAALHGGMGRWLAR